ncbi:MAG: dTDP-glucose 4,6-dehydratase [Nitrosopumilus sp.]|uniref:dTDP-glucose 4,6-dehydratase n=1 Tax=Nitrosopumilus sp. TaxID=2024843 RepID=UPI00247D9E46|nr:dTDP-glucose 4,6-dehydratase [Nitrosopumilus sp.]MCV0393514.1 dTDP-glucose 4,6-dehydratase [Nitrosopumilus sp.]
MKILVTGGCGFIGSNFIIEFLNSKKNASVINLDAMLIGSNPLNLQGIKTKNYRFVKGNICDKKIIEKLIPKVDCVINFAAHSHVDRSIKNSMPFLKSNVQGVHTILETLRKNKKVRLIQISTDEVFGETLSGMNKENSPLCPSNPYSATKASAEMLVKAYARTYELDTIITRCTNNYGPRQFPEKLIPKTIIAASRNEKIPIHGDGQTTRHWTHVFDHCNALLKVAQQGKSNQIYHIADPNEITDLKIVKNILKLMGKSEDLIEFVPERPGKDKRYSLDTNLTKKKLRWKPKIPLNQGIKDAIEWYLANKKQWGSISKKARNPTPWLKSD